MLVQVENLNPTSYVLNVNRDVNRSVSVRTNGESETEIINKNMELESVSYIEWVQV